MDRMKGLVFYAHNDIAVYGAGVANNGGGTDGQEYTFPAQSMSNGLFVTLNLTQVILVMNSQISLY